VEAKTPGGEVSLGKGAHPRWNSGQRSMLWLEKAVLGGGAESSTEEESAVGTGAKPRSRS